MQTQPAYEVFDAKGVVLGRLASTVAKRLLQNKHVVVINAEHAIITGNRKNTIARYKARVDLKDKVNPEHSPYWSRRPDLLFKRIVRGMLPFKDTHGKHAHKRLRVFMGAPAEFSNAKHNDFGRADLSALYVNHVKLNDLSKTLGYTR